MSRHRTILAAGRRAMTAAADHATARIVQAADDFCSGVGVADPPIDPADVEQLLDALAESQKERTRLVSDVEGYRLVYQAAQEEIQRLGGKVTNLQHELGDVRRTLHHTDDELADARRRLAALADLERGIRGQQYADAGWISAAATEPGGDSIRFRNCRFDVDTEALPPLVAQSVAAAEVLVNRQAFPQDDRPDDADHDVNALCVVDGCVVHHLPGSTEPCS